MIDTVRRHWPEYLMEAAELGLFMISAGLFSTLLGHPGSPLRQAIPDLFLRRALVGLAMGLTAILIVYSPMGKQSGAHFNPAVTLTFFRLGKVAPWDALFYGLAQFAGGALGLGLVSLLLGNTLGHPEVNYIVTLPGPDGPGIAFLAEVVISFLLMTVVLAVSNADRLAPYTALFSGALVATFISLEAPLSGMSMNPARSFASALNAQLWTALWIYFAAPPLGMLAAAQVRLWVRGPDGVWCAKLHHQNNKRCIFCADREAHKSHVPQGETV